MADGGRLSGLFRNLGRRNGRGTGRGTVPCGGGLVCLLKKAAETGPREGFQARVQSAHGRKIMKISSVVGAVPCFRRLFELAGHAPGTRNCPPACPPPIPPENTKKQRLRNLRHTPSASPNIHYRFASSSVISSHVTPLSAINTIMW